MSRGLSSWRGHRPDWQWLASWCRPRSVDLVCIIHSLYRYCHIILIMVLSSWYHCTVSSLYHHHGIAIVASLSVSSLWQHCIIYHSLYNVLSLWQHCIITVTVSCHCNHCDNIVSSLYGLCRDVTESRLALQLFSHFVCDPFYASVTRGLSFLRLGRYL